MVHSAASPTLAPGRRGWLKNGNRPGDYRAAPRCGAKTRLGGCCAQPAMRNGRCRFHGGKSTGARTAAGRARCARARRTHGFYSAETVALRRQARAHFRRVRTLLAAAGARPARLGRPAGHGVLPSESRRQKTEDGKRLAATASLHPIPHDASHRTFCPPSSVLCPPVPAGHGVLRSFLHFVRTAARWLGR
jgi:glucans biosynthesis protein